MPDVISMRKKFLKKTHEEIQTTSKCQFLKLISATKQNLNSVFLFFQRCKSFVILEKKHTIHLRFKDAELVNEVEQEKRPREKEKQ